MTEKNLKDLKFLSSCNTEGQPSLVYIDQIVHV